MREPDRALRFTLAVSSPSEALFTLDEDDAPVSRSNLPEPCHVDTRVSESSACQ